MVPRQSATSGRTVVTRISLGFAPPSAHRYRIISYRTPVARVSDAGNPDLTSGAIRQAGIFSEGIFTVSKVARAGSHFGGLAMPIVPKLLAYILLLTHRKQQLRSHMHQQRRWQSDHLHSRHFAFREPRQLSSRHRTWPRRFGHFLGQRTAELIPQAGIL